MTQPPDRTARALDNALQDFLAAQSAPARPAPKGRPSPSAGPASPRTPERAPRPSRGVSLEQAYDQVLEHEVEKRRVHVVHVPWWRKALPWVVVLGLLATAGWIVFGKPAWLYPPPPVPVEASRAPMARAYLRTAANLVEVYRQQYHQLPPSLAALNAPIPNMEYVPRADGSYLLRTSLGSHILMLEGTPEGVAELRETHQ